MIQIRQKEKERNKMSRILMVLLISLTLCIGSGSAEASAASGQGPKGFPVINGGANEDTGTSEENGGTESTENKSTEKTTEQEKKPVVTIETVRLTGTSSTVIVSSKDGKISYYYVLMKEDGETAPTAEEVKKNGTKSKDGYISLAPPEEDVEFVIYVVAEDEDGKLSDVVSKRGASSASRGIEVLGHMYCKLQTRDEIDDYTNEPGVITISTGSKKNVKRIEYIIADTFVNSTGMVDSIATQKQDGATSAGPSEVTFYKWSDYDSKEKPGLVRNMLNYIYVRITDEDDTVTYISSRGIWEDETEPMANSVTAETEENSAVVTVEGSDDESGIRTYYFLLRDPIDVSPVDAEVVKKDGMESEDGIFEVTGLRRRKKYNLYAVVEDMAGNLSPVKEGTMTTAGDATASSVRTSSDKSSNPGSTSNVAKGTEGISLDDPESVETVADRTPFLISSEEKKSSEIIKIAGWDNIKTVVEKSKQPADYYVNMNGAVVVPGDVLESVAGKRITLHFIMDDYFIWVVNGRNISSTPMSTDFRVTRGKSRIPARLINELAGVYPREEFTIEHEGGFDFEAGLEIRLGAENGGKNAHLYYYNGAEDHLELLSSVTVDDNGKAAFDLPDETDYVVIVGPASEKPKQDETSTEAVRSTENDAGEFANTQKSSGGTWIAIVSVVGVMLFVFILILPHDKDIDKDETDGSEQSQEKTEVDE